MNHALLLLGAEEEVREGRFGGCCLPPPAVVTSVEAVAAADAANARPAIGFGLFAAVSTEVCK